MKIAEQLSIYTSLLLGQHRLAKDDISITIARAQQLTLYRQLFPLAVVPIITSTILALCLVGTPSVKSALVWYALYVPIPIFLLVASLKNQKSAKSAQEDTNTARPFSGRLTRASENVSTLSGIYWGIATPLFAYQSNELLVFMAVVQISHSCGFAQLVAPLPRMVFRFTSLSLVPLAVMLIVTGDMHFVTLGALTLVVLGSIMYSSFTNFNQLRKVALSEARALRAESLLRASINAMPDAFAVYSFDRQIVLENKNHAEWALKYEVPATDAGEHISRKDDGKWIKHSWNIVPDVGTLTIHTDVTSQKLRETQLIQAREEAQLANGAQSRFLSRISHELRTPLNSVLGFSELLEPVAQKQKSWETVGEYVDYIHSAGKHLLSLVDDIIDFTSIGDDIDQLNLRAVEIALTVKRAVEIGRAKAGVPSNHNILIRLHDDVRFMTTDRHILERILANIISNAIKFSSPDSKIAISTSLSEDDAPVLTVRDFGYGMTQAQIKDAFTVFYQGDESHQRQSDGTGMGLAVVQRLAKLIEAEIKMISKPGRGTAVMITFSQDSALFTPKRDHQHSPSALNA